MSITSLTAKAKVLATTLDQVAASADRANTAVRTVRPAMEDSEKATDSALSKLRQAADAFGGQFGSTSYGEDGEVSGGFLTAGYAYDLVQQYVNILDILNSKSQLAMLHGPKLKQGLQDLEGFFQKFFPQFGRLSKLAKDWQKEMDAGAQKAANLVKLPKGSSGSGSSSSSSNATSTGLVL